MGQNRCGKERLLIFEKRDTLLPLLWESVCSLVPSILPFSMQQEVSNGEDCSDSPICHFYGFPTIVLLGAFYIVLTDIPMSVC